MVATASFSDVSERITAHVASKLEAAMSDYMGEAQAQIRDLISVPVQYMSASGQLSLQGRRRPHRIGAQPGPGLLARTPPQRLIVRSKQGEPPRKEFGNYYESMKAVVTNDGNRVIGVLGTDIRDGRAWKLELGLNRPHFRPMYQRMRNECVSKIKGYLSYFA